MCAIFGGQGLDRSTVESMSRAMTHRGPDGSGFSVTKEWGIGMNRLAILDLEKGDQPFRSGDVEVVCNGEIYNWRELRSELKALGYAFHTECDCEILPAAWREWGTAMFLKLNGMFAMAIKEGVRVVLARDRCGQKPLYYSSGENGFVFSSEIRGLEAAGIERQADPSVLGLYLMLRYVPEPQTFWKGVEMLQAGHYMEVGQEPARYWSPEFTAPCESYGEAVETLERLVESAVKRCLQSDVPVAAYLSAGVDSSLLVDEVLRAGGSVETVSLGFGSGADETDEARDFAQQRGMTNHAVMCGPECLKELPRVTAQMERPVGDLLTLAFDQMARATAELGNRVVLGGEGADELFGGYSFQKTQLLVDSAGGLGRSAIAYGLGMAPLELLDKVSGFPAGLGKSGRKKIVEYVKDYSQASHWWRGVGLRSLFSPSELQDLLVPEVAVAQPILSKDVDHLAHQFEGWLQDWALIRQDKNTSAHSVEFRAPFLDSELLDFSFKIPQEWKLTRAKDKIIWRDMAQKKLKHPVSARGKQPFYLPLEQPEWSRPLWQLIDDALEYLPSTGWFQPLALTALQKRARESGEFLPLKQLASLVILHLHITE